MTPSRTQGRPISLLLLIEYRETLVAAVVAMYCEMAEMTFDFVKRMSEF